MKYMKIKSVKNNIEKHIKINEISKIYCDKAVNVIDADRLKLYNISDSVIVIEFKDGYNWIIDVTYIIEFK